MDNLNLKARVREHWENEVCGSRYGSDATARMRFFDEIDTSRYAQDYMLRNFALFSEARGKKVLEVGLGSGSDFLNWVRAGATATGRDLTEASVRIIRERLELEGLEADVRVGDAEALDLPSESFDLYYSWGVLHHTPNTEATIAEAHRVLKPGGSMKVMLYHYPSVGAFLVWLAHGLLRFDLRGPRAVCADHIESPGTQMFTVEEARHLVGRYFSDRPIEIQTYLGSGDLLTHKLSGRYGGRAWRVAAAVFPRWFVRRVLGHRFGTTMTIHTIK